MKQEVYKGNQMKQQMKNNLKNNKEMKLLANQNQKTREYKNKKNNNKGINQKLQNDIVKLKKYANVKRTPSTSSNQSQIDQIDLQLDLTKIGNNHSTKNTIKDQQSVSDVQPLQKDTKELKNFNQYKQRSDFSNDKNQQQINYYKTPSQNKILGNLSINKYQSALSSVGNNSPLKNPHSNSNLNLNLTSMNSQCSQQMSQNINQNFDQSVKNSQKKQIMQKRQDSKNNNNQNFSRQSSKMSQNQQELAKISQRISPEKTSSKSRFPTSKKIRPYDVNEKQNEEQINFYYLNQQSQQNDKKKPTITYVNPGGTSTKNSEKYAKQRNNSLTHNQKDQNNNQSNIYNKNYINNSVKKNNNFDNKVNQYYSQRSSKSKQNGQKPIQQTHIDLQGVV
ncbi:hypothetical protein PPERSA_08856 [Pseudocohnilembus persalinus]|uniref:Uncharacterized protein n=1 Tax=Pseudocohnilembus persalinus TaxID=266149 RepID=A0A0V0R3T4_PSEPJ|nr:hypothetical protein PPERSA_08856 [Pseudocohnilembus persalinus]|eukprot:KRX09140.1 hypothetical protein PPERSA_08856 [Pseudocohnilembus persalinus]